MTPGQTAVVAADLDRTLIYSRAAIDAALPPDGVPPLLCVERLDGRDQSFLTAAAGRWLGQLAASCVLVPTTTRTPAQYGRVDLPVGQVRYAVTSNGGQIVVDGRPDPRWRRQVERRIAGDGAGLADVVAELDRRTQGSWVCSRRIADDVFCYLVVDLDRLPAEFVPDWAQWCTARNWVVSVQGRKIYALPRALTKEAAVAEVMRRAGAGRLLAAGDGALDAGLLSLAQAGIRPRHGELHELGWSADHVRVTDATGVLAGEEIARWLTLQITAPADSVR